MNKQIFNEEIFVQLNNEGPGIFLKAWHTRRLEIFKVTNQEQRSIDYVFLQAMGAGGGIPSTIEALAPGITERYRQYTTLQSQLLRDLLKLNKLVAGEITPFREWLNQL